MVLKAFLSKLAPEQREALESFLPEAEQQKLQSLPDLVEPPTAEKFANGGMLEDVHWSWFLPALKTSSREEQRLFLSAMSSHSAKNLAKELGLSEADAEISTIGRSYLQEFLLDGLLGPGDQLLPPEYLPQSPLLPLLDLAKPKLKQLIDFLSLYDLATEIRQIVETKILKKIYSLLLEEERVFLKGIQAHKELMPRMLDRWDGEKESFRTLLHKRGLARLGLGLSGQSPDLIWYICHRLDIGRGNALFKLCAAQEIPDVTHAVIRQIEEVLAKL